MRKSNQTIKLYSFLCICVFLAVLTSCGKGPGDGREAKTDLAQNPFLQEYDTPYQIPPFDRIEEAHFMPAFQKGMERQKEEIDAIIQNPEPPTFANTLIPLEKSGRTLSRVSAVFWHLNGTDTTDGIQAIAREVTPLLSRHQNDIALNDPLFQRVKAIYGQKESLELGSEESRLLEETYRDFIRSGADLPPEAKEKVKKINEQISDLALQFRNNLLKETNSFKLFLDRKKDLEGLPRDLIDAAAKAASGAGREGQWLFTLHKPSWIPFLQNSPRRELREKLYRGYFMRGDNDNEFDNKKIIAQMAALRVRRANLMGYKTHADYRLEINMAQTPENVYRLLNRVWEPALEMAREEVRQMQAIIDREGGDFNLQSWDWWYYAEKLRQEKYALNEGELKPYFEVNAVREGAFEVANRLYGITFTERNDLPRPHPDAKVFEVREADGTHLGILFTDYFYRESKRGGAWCGSLQGYSNIEGDTRHPLVYTVCNFPQPVGDTPSLLSFDQALTLWHEFGHALHVLFNRTTYPGISRVARDFVELPSQIMEHWCAHPEVLKSYTRHYRTGDPIPDELIDKLEKSSLFNQGFVTVEYVAAALLDMNYHTLTTTEPVDTASFEKNFIDRIGLIPQIIPRYRSTYFQHIIGGYDAGYYAYIWSEVLDCDAFEAFLEKGLYDQKTARSFRDHILARGGSEDEMVMYKKFRGREPRIDGLLKKRGLQ